MQSNLHPENLVRGMAMEKQIDWIEKILLPDSAHFSSDQKDVILATGNVNIVAGPGSGKTTVLSAKILNLLKCQRPGDKGICCLTHTNVAVDEIKQRIRRGGISEIQYPNFVGTIQSFLDQFFAKKAFAHFFPDLSMRVMDGDPYYDLYSKIFLELVDWSSDYDAPKPSNKHAKLVFKDSELPFFTNSGKSSYRKKMNIALESLLKKGIIDNDQLTSFASWYISKYGNQLRAAFDERFNLFLLDEAQDTNKAQYKLLKSITEETDICFQCFGDPYQALYTIYGTESDDAWVPNQEQEKGVSQKLEIPTTSRFGENITDLVKHVCYEEYPTFHSTINDDQQVPIFFLTYEDHNELLGKYEKMIQYYSARDDAFRNCNKKDVIVAPQHKDLEKTFPGLYVQPQINATNHENNFKNIYHICIQELARLNKRSPIEEAQAIKQNYSKGSFLASIIKRIYGGDNDFRSLVPLLAPLLIPKENSAYDKEFYLRVAENLDHDVHQIVSQAPAMTEQNCKIEISTIHGVKGETHRSTILLIDSPVEGKVSNNKFLHALFPFLVGRRLDYGKYSDAKLYKDCLKFAYVALSRPKYLAGIAVPASELDNQKKDDLLNAGWHEWSEK